MTALPALPVLVPAATAIAVLALRRHPAHVRALSLGSGLLLLAIAALLVLRTVEGQVLVMPVGAWAPRVGIAWAVDRLSALMLVLAAATSLATIVYAPPALPNAQEADWFPVLHPLVVMGVNGSFVTADLFNLFVFFEIMLVSSFVLISLGPHRSEGRGGQLAASFPYVVVNLVGSALLFAGVGVVYATAGSVNMAEVAARVREATLPAPFWAGLALILVVFALKAALVPLHVWLPDSYPRAPLPVAAFFAGVLTKVGVYTLFRGVTLFTDAGMTGVHRALLALSAATMLIGVLGALGRGSVRGILSFHIVSQVGYMVFGLALFTPFGLAAGIFYVMHHILVKAALFLAGGVVERLGGGALGAVHGVARTHPWAGVCFLVPALSLAGIPPLSGFWGKLFLLMAGIRAGAFVTTGIAVVVSLLTLASMLKIWFSAYWGAPDPPVALPPRTAAPLIGPPLALAVLSLTVGLSSPLLWGHAERTAAALLQPTAYIEAITTLSRPGSGWRGAEAP